MSVQTAGNNGTTVRSNRVGRAVGAGAASAAAASVASLIVWGLARAAGADLVAQGPGQPAIEIGPFLVLIAIIGPALLGTLVLVLVRGWAPRAWQWVATAGLVLGVVTAPAPWTVEAETGTRVALASMHVITGVAWLVLVRRATRQATAGGR